MSEQDLREALTALAAPTDPPLGGRTRIVASVRRRVRRRRLTLAAALTGAAVVVSAGGIVLDRLGQQDEDTVPLGPGIETGQRIPTTAPYEAPGCPGDVRAAEWPYQGTLPGLRNLASVRICFHDADAEYRRVPLRPAQTRPDPEALVFGLERLSQRIGALATADPRRCEMFSARFPGPLVVLTYADGTRKHLNAGLCSDVHHAGRLLDGGDVLGVLNDLLDEQRGRYAYTREVDVPLDCDWRGYSGPVRPGREQVIAATACGHYDEKTGDYPATVLGATEVAKLQDAFADAAPYVRESPSAADPCLNDEDEMPFLMLRTDRGDSVTLRATNCDWLHLDSGWGRMFRSSSGWEVPITLADLD